VGYFFIENLNIFKKFDAYYAIIELLISFFSFHESYCSTDLQDISKGESKDI